jgi:hypothetical protein
MCNEFVLVALVNVLTRCGENGNQLKSAMLFVHLNLHA